MQKLLLAVLFGIGLLGMPGLGTAESLNLEGSWSGSGSLTFAAGGKEHATCRATYSRRPNGGYVVRAVCATASAKAVQTAALRKVADNRYAGNFYNSEYDVSGTISVVVPYCRSAGVVYASGDSMRAWVGRSTRHTGLPVF